MHIYTVNDQEYPSVTTIIHILGNDRLMQWSNIMGFKRKHIDQILEDSSTYGTIAHAVMRSMIDPSAPVEDEEIPSKYLLRLYGLKTKFSAFQREHQITPIYTEKTFVSEKLGYGGTLDIFGSVIENGVLYKDYILDFKTAKSVHSTMWLQMGGYYNLAKENGLKPQGAGIIRLNDDSIRINLIDKKELKEYASSFLYLKKFYDFWRYKMEK